MTALHVTFIGGFGLMTLVIATRVIVAHCNFDEMWEVNSWRVALPGILFILALLARIGADLIPQYYLGLLSAGAGIWLIGALTWGAIFAPRVGPSNISPDD